MDVTKARDLMPWFFLSLFMVSLVVLGWLLWPFASVLIMAAVLTSVFNPVFQVIRKKTGPDIASLITCLAVFLLVFVPIVLFVGLLSREAYGLYQTARDAALADQIRSLLTSSRIVEKVNALLAAYDLALTGEQIHKALSEAGKVVGLFVYEQASAIASNIVSFVTYFFFMLLVIYYLLIDGDRLMAFIESLSPLPAVQYRQLTQKFKDMAGAILVGNGLAGLAQGLIGGLVFYFFDLKSPFLWGVVMAILAFLPVVGITVVAVPAAIYLFLVGRVGTAVFFIVFFTLLSQGAEYLFKTRLVGQRVKMHTLLLFLVTLGGLKLFGMLGIVYGPLAATAFLTLTEIYHAGYRNGPEQAPQGTI